MSKKFTGHCDHDGTMQVQRLRGTRQRRRCTVCLYWGPWEPQPKKDVLNKKVEQYEKASDDLRAVYFSKTAAELKQIAKDKGLKGYSKMTKADLVDALA